MKIRDLVQRGRRLDLVCPGPHDDGGTKGARHVPLDLSKVDPDMTIDELRTKARCPICGKKVQGRGALIPQSDRQMRQGRQVKKPEKAADRYVRG